MSRSDPPRTRYTGVAIALHWLIALGILAMLAMGLVMTHVKLAPFMVFKLYQLHKSVGILVSASPLNIPTILYGVIPWPHLPVFSTLADKAHVAPVLGLIHAYGAYVLLALLLLHAGAALRHHIVMRDEVLRRMIPGLPRLGVPHSKRV